MPAGHAAKRNHLMWALTGLLLVLAASIAYLQWRTTADELPRRAADDVSTITITRLGHEPIVIERSNGWQITSPVNMPANPQRITPLLTIYTNPDPGYAISSVDLEATGLKSPEATLSFDDYKVEIGQVAVDGSKRHALHGTRVRFVPDWVLPFLQGGVSAMADLTVWGENLEQLSISTAGTVNEETLEAARALVAQQFVDWPREDAPQTLSKHSIQSVHNGKTTDWIVTITERYAAIQAKGANSAYITSTEDIAWLLNAEP